MTIKEAWQRLEEAQLQLEKFLETHGGVMDDAAGCHVFPIVSQTKEFGGLVQVAICISDAQGYLEDLIEEGDRR